MVAVVTGEGGSGGALGIACGSRVLILEHAVYSVIPPEGPIRSSGAARARRPRRPGR
jgi:acetyl-CoA carboxylase alpha subunit